MSQGINFLQLIDCDEEDAELPSASLCDCYRLFQTVLEKRAVWEAGQGVVIGQPVYFRGSFG